MLFVSCNTPVIDKNKLIYQYFLKKNENLRKPQIFLGHTEPFYTFNTILASSMHSTQTFLLTGNYYVLLYSGWNGSIQT